MKRAIGYLRVSTDGQADSGAGLDAQRDAIALWCAREGVSLASVHADEGVSGAAPLEARTGLLAALGELASDDVLLVAKRDRLARDPILGAMVERMADRQGARVVSAAGEGTDDDGPTSVLMRRIVDAFAEYERLVIGARTRAALAAKRVRGERVGAVPYGYRLAGDGVALIEDAAEQAVICEARKLRAAGLSLRAVAADLASRGFKPRGERWHATQINRMLAA